MVLNYLPAFCEKNEVFCCFFEIVQKVVSEAAYDSEIVSKACYDMYTGEN
jgi:hypothetical protein